MNKEKDMRYLRPRLLLALPFALAGLAARIGPLAAAHADYGTHAQYQIEISYNCNNPTCTPVIGSGAGIWLWIELNANGTGDYHGSDCLHGAAAFPDSGDVTWADTGTELVISGLSLAGGSGVLPSTITVPDTYGHHLLTFSQLFGIPFPTLPGAAQVQVAP
jgi:hypothetical protein